MSSIEAYLGKQRYIFTIFIFSTVCIFHFWFYISLPWLTSLYCSQFWHNYMAGVRVAMETTPDCTDSSKQKLPLFVSAGNIGPGLMSQGVMLNSQWVQNTCDEEAPVNSPIACRYSIITNSQQVDKSQRYSTYIIWEGCKKKMCPRKLEIIFFISLFSLQALIEATGMVQVFRLLRRSSLRAQI